MLIQRVDFFYVNNQNQQEIYRADRILPQ